MNQGPEDPSKLPSLFESAADEEAPSITDVHGTVARFEMAYSPEKGEKHFFGPPITQLAPSWIYLTFALFVAAVVALGHVSGSNTSLYVWVVERDQSRPFGAVPLAGIVLVSAIATVVRARMRGVIVGADGLETREILGFGVPRVRKLTWAQIDRVLVDDKSLMLELWNGEYQRLPAVRDFAKLSKLMLGIAAARQKQVTHLDRDDK